MTTCGGVSPALVAHDDVVTMGQEVDDLPFGLIAPLQTHHARRWHGVDPYE